MGERIRVIGGGLAGCEAAWQIARRGVPVELWEMRPVRGTEAHVTDRLAELVCSNSFRSDDAERNAVGLLHEEMRRADSLVMAAADRHKVPAGQALAVDRTGFADAVQQAIEDEPAIWLRRAEMPGLPDAADGLAIVATGPLTAPASQPGDPGCDRRGPSRLLRRAGTHRPSRQHRFRDRLVPVPLRQGGAGRRPRGLHQLSARPRALRGLHRRPARRRYHSVQGLGARHALFRRLPAHRGDGGARAATRSASAP